MERSERSTLPSIFKSLYCHIRSRSWRRGRRLRRLLCGGSRHTDTGASVRRSRLWTFGQRSVRARPGPPSIRS